MILVIAGAVWLYWYQENERRKSCTILTIRMSSGTNKEITLL